MRCSIGCGPALTRSKRSELRLWQLPGSLEGCWELNGLSLIDDEDSARGTVQCWMAFSTERDQIGLCVFAKGTSPFHVVDIEIPSGPTFLTTPTISLQDFSSMLRI